MNAVRILVVDDEAEMLRAVVRILQGSYEVQSTTSPNDALDLALEFQPQLAIVDIRMPEMDGFQLMSRLHRQHKGIQVILMTGSVYDIDVQLIRALREEAFYYINKPFDRGVLYALVQRCIQFQERRNQVIQSEKLASLGKLTAGVAHEISNPLNFVNNFSRLSLERLRELEAEMLNLKENAVVDWANLEGLFSDVFDNIEKIHKHGSRASRVVGSMIDHARAQPGSHAATNLAELVEQCLILAYREFQAQEEGFEAELIQHYDELIGDVDVVRSTIGRALLNIFRNAFYAVFEKQSQLGHEYVPKICVRADRIGDHVEIQVLDNGVGISETHLDKVFEPFFSTKPTGQGTGLGLSLAYEIIHRGHGGVLSVESSEGDGAAFRIVLPIRGVNVSD